jgi:hypothetical protein
LGETTKAVLAELLALQSADQAEALAVLDDELEKSADLKFRAPVELKAGAYGQAITGRSVSLDAQPKTQRQASC